MEVYVSVALVEPDSVFEAEGVMLALMVDERVLVPVLVNVPVLLPVPLTVGL